MSTIAPSARRSWAILNPNSQRTSSLDELDALISEFQSSSMIEWPELIDELRRIRNYRDDWDGEGTESLDPELVDGAIALAQDLNAEGIPSANRVLAGVNRTLYFEWYATGGYREIEVSTLDHAELRIVPTGSKVADVFVLNRRTS